MTCICTAQDRPGYEHLYACWEHQVAALSARVEALERERDEYEQIFELQRTREAPWVALWQRETGKHDTLPDYGAFLGWLVDKVRDGERLRAALAEIIDAHDDWTTACQHDDGACPVHEIAWKCGDALTATVDHHRATLEPCDCALCDAARDALAPERSE